jgi:hypothetical protein
MSVNAHQRFVKPVLVEFLCLGPIAALGMGVRIGLNATAGYGTDKVGDFRMSERIPSPREREELHTTSNTAVEPRFERCRCQMFPWSSIATLIGRSAEDALVLTRKSKEDRRKFGMIEVIQPVLLRAWNQH